MSDALDIADQLYQAATNHHGYRAATARAYIATFQHLRDHPKVSFLTTGKGADHQNLIAHLSNHSDRNLKTIGLHYLRPLRDLRNSSDYNLTVPFTKGMAEHAVELATEVIHVLLP